MSNKVKKSVEVSEELYTTQDLVISQPVAVEGTEELDVEVNEDQEELDDHQDNHEAYETDEELLAESENLELSPEDENDAEEAIEPMEEDSERNEETTTDATNKMKAKVSTQNRVSELPLSKVKHIIKLDPDVKLVNSEAVYIITRATEFFVRSLAKEAHNNATQQKKKTLTKSHVDQALAMLPIEL